MLEPPRKKVPVTGVSDRDWARFVRALEVQPIKAVSASGGLGSYDMRPRRLVELGLAKNLRSVRSDQGRQIYHCDLIPMPIERFLRDPIAQYSVLAVSMERYAHDLDQGIFQKPESLSRAGALAVLHIGGRGALQAWPNLFEHTRARTEAAQGAF